jgi:hypothetical protein
MMPEQIYASLLTLYPKAFREAYGGAMLDAFREWHRANRRPPLAFWRLAVADLARSVCREQLDACRSGVRRFVLHWLAVCAFGVIVTGLVANLVTWCFGYLYHPYLEGLRFAPWTYGAFLGAGLGVAQTAVLRDRFRVGVAWVLVSAASTALGLHLTAVVAGLDIGPVGCGIVLGGVVGSCQWMLVRTRVQRPGWPVLATALSLPIAVLLCDGLIQRALTGMNPVATNLQATYASTAYADALGVLVRGLYQPHNWTDLAVEFAAMAISGLIIGAITARQVSERRRAY